MEVIFEAHQQSQIIKALFTSHPYEEVAYNITSLDNTYQLVGSGMVGELREAMTETDFLQHLKQLFNYRLSDAQNC